MEWNAMRWLNDCKRNGMSWNGCGWTDDWVLPSSSLFVPWVIILKIHYIPSSGVKKTQSLESRMKSTCPCVQIQSALYRRYMPVAGCLFAWPGLDACGMCNYCKYVHNEFALDFKYGHPLRVFEIMFSGSFKPHSV